jgi:predicted CXXCH cytochrome family protein
MKILIQLPLAFAALVLLLASPALGASSCVTSQCHAAIGSLKMPHAPVKEGECLQCHKALGKEHPLKGGKSFELTGKGASLCNQCHDAKGKGKVVHEPVKEGDCTSCPKPHGAGRNLLEVDEIQTNLCLGCHDGAPFKQKFMHGPAAVGSCTQCHDPHQAPEKGLLKEPIRNLCLKCHADFDATLKAAAVAHPPVKEGPCTACHNPHGSGVVSFLNKKIPELCIECHAGIGKKLAVVKVPHKPVTQQGGCINCHAAHYSKAKGMLAAEEMTVCLSCHDKDNMGSPALRNIKKDLEGKKYLHGPIAKGTCKACHDPHGSEYFRMLPGNYPATLYAPYKDGIYGACLKCHEQNLLRFAETTIYTGFRNGKRNLHYVHVANKQKGRTCRICHEPHASDNPKLIRKEGSQFGEWKIPLNFKITQNGGSCAPGCHRAFTYDREKPVVYGGYSAAKRATK